MKKIFVLVLFTTLIAASCTNHRNKDYKKIKDIQKIVHNKTSLPGIDKVNELINLYNDFAKNYPNDTNSAGFLFDAANLSVNINPIKAIELFDKIINEYPNDKRIPDCMFYKAFVYDEKLKDIKKAKAGYEEYLKKYPKHIFAKDVPSLIEMLGKTPEQIDAEFKTK